MTEEDSKENYRKIFNNLKVGYFKAELDGIIKEHNQSLSIIGGYDSSKSLVGLKTRDLWDYIEEQEEYLELIKKNGYVKNFVIHVTSPKGKKLVIIMNSRTVKDHDNNPLYTEGTFTEISEGYVVDKKLRESQKRLKFLVSSSPAVIYTSRTSGNYGGTYISENVKNLTGYKPEDFIKNSNFWIDHVHPDDKEKVLSGLTTLNEKGQHAHEYRFQYRDGTYHWVLDECNLIRDENDNPIETIGFWVDITERKEMESKLEESEKKFRELSKDLEHKVEKRTKELDISKVKYRDMINNLDVGFYKGEFKGKLLMHNQKLNEILGIDPSINLVGSKSNQFFIDSETHEKYYEIIIKNGNLKDFIAQIKKPDGEKLIVQLNSHLIRNSKGEPIEIEGTILNITDRFRLEQKLKKEEQEKSIVLENILEHFVFQSLDHTVKYLNKAACDSVDQSPEQLVGRKCHEIWHNRDIVCEKCPVELSLKTRKPEINEIETSEGRIWIVKGYPILDENGNLIGAVELTTEMTEQRRIERKLKQSEQKYRFLVEQSLQGICIMHDVRIIFANKALSEILGYCTEELLSLSRDEVENIIHPDDREFVLNRHLDRLKGISVPSHYEFRIIRKDGKVRTVDMYASLIKLDNKSYVQEVFVDITERKNAEQKLKESEARYREVYSRANFYKDLFAHDINNILQNIISASELSSIYINKSNQQEKLTKTIDIVKEQVKKGANLILNVRKLSEIEETQISLEPTNIYEVLKSSTDFCKNSFQNRDINIEIDSFSEKIYIQANSLLSDLVENILLNGITHNRSPKVEINIKISKKQQDGIKYIKMELVDNGVGIPNDQKKFIFEKKTDGYESGRGMGLGLSLVKKIIDCFNGQIWVEDRVEGDYSKGSNFVLIFPEVE